MNFLDGMDGWETLKARKRVLKLVRAFQKDETAAPEAYDVEDAAMLDASHHRRTTQTPTPNKKRLPLV